MKKLFDRDEIWFAVLCIATYVVGFSSADQFSESIGMPKLLTCLFGFLMSGVLYRFIRKNRLQEYLGLCPAKGSCKEYLYFIPLLVISSVNLWNAAAIQHPIHEIILYMVSMCFVAFLEEVIFRGLLFKGMCKSNPTSAILISSLTFGMGHIVNLLTGAPLFDTLLQLVYASAIGFCFTAVFCITGSILPCILAHAVVNSLSILAVEPTPTKKLIFALAQTIISTGYGAWLLRKKTWQP